MNTVPEEGKLYLLPPYLWIWLIIFVATFPFNLNYLQILLSDVFSTTPLPGEDILPFGFLLRMANFVELFPLLIIIIGVLSLAVPSISDRTYGGSMASRTTFRSQPSWRSPRLSGITCPMYLYRTTRYAEIRSLSSILLVFGRRVWDSWGV